MRAIAITGAAVLAVALSIGCGIKGPPLPPIETVEDKTVNATQLKEAPATGTKENETTESAKKKK